MTSGAVHTSQLASGRINTGPLAVYPFGDPATRTFIANHVAHITHEKRFRFFIHSLLCYRCREKRITRGIPSEQKVR